MEEDSKLRSGNRELRIARSGRRAFLGTRNSILKDLEKELASFRNQKIRVGVVRKGVRHPRCDSKKDRGQIMQNLGGHDQDYILSEYELIRGS